MGSKSFKGQKIPRKDCFMFAPEDLTLQTDKSNPFYDPRVEMPLDESLVQSIEALGIIEPVIVKREGELAVVVAGRQRVRAAIELNKRLAKQGTDPVRVPCLIQRGSDIDLYGCTIAENEVRRDDDPMAKAEKCARYINGGRTEAEAAVVFGVSTQTIRQWLKILELSAPVQKAVRRGEIATSAAVKLSALPVDEQKAALDEARKEGKPTTQVAADLVRSRRAKTGKKTRTVRRRKEIEQQLETWSDAPFAPILRWFLGEDCDFESLSE